MDSSSASATVRAHIRFILYDGGLAAPVTLDGGPGNNQLVISDAGRVAANTFWVTSQAVSGDAEGFVVFYQATGGTFSRGVRCLM